MITLGHDLTQVKVIDPGRKTIGPGADWGVFE